MARDRRSRAGSRRALPRRLRWRPENQRRDAERDDHAASGLDGCAGANDAGFLAERDNRSNGRCHNGRSRGRYSAKSSGGYRRRSDFRFPYRSAAARAACAGSGSTCSGRSDASETDSACNRSRAIDPAGSGQGSGHKRNGTCADAERAAKVGRSSHREFLGMAEIRLIALKAIDLRGRHIAVNEAFTTFRKDGKKLIAAGDAKAMAVTAPRAPAAVAPAPAPAAAAPAVAPAARA